MNPISESPSDSPALAVPDALEPQPFYQPVPRGLELKIGEKLRHLAELDRSSPRQRRKP